jgi:hypothetical protein
LAGALTDALTDLPDAAGLRPAAALPAGVERTALVFDRVRREVDLTIESQFQVWPAPNDHARECRRKQQTHHRVSA